MEKFNKATVNTLIAGAFATTMGAAGAASAMEHEHGASADMEKCYGVVKAGNNMCASANNSHSCAGMATTDADGNEWISLPKGVCEQLAGGSLEPVTSESSEGDMQEMKEEMHEEKGHH